MAEKYYQGEDISITIVIYEDQNMILKRDLTNVEVDMVLCNMAGGTKIIASTDAKIVKREVAIERIDANTLRVVFNSFHTARLSEGMAQVEMKVRDLIKGTTTISTNDSIIIESSIIGKLT
ncbi:MAG: hypothetical protein RR277_09135 [Rikenellaceae bacterium]